MTVVGRSLLHSTLVRICKEIRSWHMSPFQIGLVRILVRIFKMLLNRAPVRRMRWMRNEAVGGGGGERGGEEAKPRGSPNTWA